MTTRSPADRDTSVLAHRWLRRTALVAGCVWLGGVATATGLALHHHLTSRWGTPGLFAVVVVTLVGGSALAWWGGVLMERRWPRPDVRR